MGYDVHVGVNNSYGHCAIFCFGFLRYSESVPYRDIVGSPHTLSGNRTEPVRIL